MKVTDFKFGLIGPTYEFASCVTKKAFQKSVHVDLYRQVTRQFCSSRLPWRNLLDGLQADGDVQLEAELESREQFRLNLRKSRLEEAGKATEELKMLLNLNVTKEQP